jgi:hypothetical protein
VHCGATSPFRVPFGAMRRASLVTEQNPGCFSDEREPLHTPRQHALMNYEGCDMQLLRDGLPRNCQDRVALA